ncbi:MAG TPA: hypothetical protein VLV76_05890 [Candidatus Acidoferrum sp.]|nr:hypothetical protein [Candidatus Acidoferrum sp.]
MEIICRECEGNAFRILPEDRGTVAAECVVCGAVTVIRVPKPIARYPANGHRYVGLASDVVAAVNRR